MRLSRRTFVATAAALGVSAPPALAAAVPAPSAPGHDVSGAVPFRFDRAQFQAIIERPYPHRQVAAPPGYAPATAILTKFSNSLRAYADPNGFAAGPNSLHCAAVLYAGVSYTLVLDDAMYAAYPLGLLNDEEMRPNDPSARAYGSGLTRNPLAGHVADMVGQGVSFFVCNNALSGFAAQLAKRTAKNGEAVTRERVVAIHDELAAHLLPGAMLVPAGVAALIALQEQRFTYLPG